MQYLKHIVCSSIALFFGVVPLSALAGPGDLDLLFGINGKVITSTGFSDEANAVALQPDGKIVVAGYTNAFGGGIVARYNTDGSLDVSFGSGGIALPGGHAHGTHFKAVQIQPDGKIIAAGHFVEPGGCPGWRGRIVRLNTDGSLDATFNSDSGMPGTWEYFFGCDATYFNSLAIQPDGKIVIAGGTYHSGPDLDFVAIRLNTNGELDTTFNLDGLATYPIGDDDEQAFSVAINPSNGKILLAGYTFGSGNKDMAFIMLTASGLYDFGFGTSGKLTINFSNRNDEANAVLFRPDGKILVGGYAAPSVLMPLDHQFAVMRLTSSGRLDTNFGTKGNTLTNFGSHQDSVSAIAVQPDGKIVAVGKSENTSGTHANFALARYSANGILDTTFGIQGKQTTDFLGGADYGRGVAIQSDGKMVAVGSAANGSDLEIALARYEP